jgi:hypothetical protein
MTNYNFDFDFDKIRFHDANAHTCKISFFITEQSNNFDLSYILCSSMIVSSGTKMSTNLLLDMKNAKIENNRILIDNNIIAFSTLLKDLLEKIEIVQIKIKNSIDTQDINYITQYTDFLKNIMNNNYYYYDDSSENSSENTMPTYHSSYHNDFYFYSQDQSKKYMSFHIEVAGNNIQLNNIQIMFYHENRWKFAKFEPTQFDFNYKSIINTIIGIAKKNEYHNYMIIKEGSSSDITYEYVESVKNSNTVSDFFGDVNALNHKIAEVVIQKLNGLPIFVVNNMDNNRLSIMYNDKSEIKMVDDVIKDVNMNDLIPDDGQD